MSAWARDMAFGPIKVEWHLWSLVGDPDTWAEQLQAHWQAQPVYALLSGAGGNDWAPVEAMCEAKRIACLFPALDRVPLQERRHWTMHLSRGVEAEALMLAQRLASIQPPPTSVLQIHDSAAGKAAASTLRQALADGPVQIAVGPEQIGLAEPSAIGPQDVVVLWLTAEKAQAWLAAKPEPAGYKLILSAQLAPPQSLSIPVNWRPRTAWVSHRSDPTRQAAADSLSLTPWLQQLALPDTLDRVVLGDVHAATFFFGDALAQTRGAYAPEHLLERLEVAVDRRPAGASYFRLSLGPGQRIASQGGHLLAFRPPDYRQLATLPGFLRSDGGQ
jgi:hypothetical protein